MDIIEFYKSLSSILETYREKVISFSDAKFKLKELLEGSELAKLDVDITADILQEANISDFDDENSYEESDYSYDSYEDDDQ